ncbi:MAG: N-acetylmuramic acid 6-phosphate etherase [Mycoplasmataceae bacterium]|nr:N-acetylmuramic acid 6-phosphate etherase [Mycoplasmataceae bacterium]
MRSINLDELDTDVLVDEFIDDSKVIYESIAKESKKISKVVDSITEKYRQGGRVIYLGSGTSGKVGILDANEVPGTFGVDSSTYFGIISGGHEALYLPLEGTEDDYDLAQSDLERINVTNKDVLILLTSSGSTPYVNGAAKYAKSKGIYSVSITNSKEPKIASYTNDSVNIITGSELIEGSTRMKAATSQKIVLNIISSSVMTKLGNVYGNKMVGVKSNNNKLLKRIEDIVIDITKKDRKVVSDCLKDNDYNAKVTILILSLGIDSNEANKLLSEQIPIKQIIKKYSK